MSIVISGHRNFIANHAPHIVNNFGEFLKTRMVRALETEDPTELHYLLAQLDDYYSYMWRYYKKLAKDRAERMNPGV